MRDSFVSIRGRVAINVEALNMTESIGNYVKHRRVPVMLREDDGSYSVYFVPAISGESVAHALQVILAEECNEAGANRHNALPVCKLCSKGILLKSSNEEIFLEAFPNAKETFSSVSQNPAVIEEFVIKNCVVEDMGGFLYAPQKSKGKRTSKDKDESNSDDAPKNVKRTSNFYTGYMIPTQEALKNAIIEPQLHSRYALGTKFVKMDARGQMLYYVELTSTVYTFSLDIDTRFIGKITFNVERAGESVVSEEERLERTLALLNSVKRLLVENSFGAKRTRFLPTIDWESMVIAVSDRPWTVPSPFTKSYIDRARQKKEKINSNTDLYIFEGGSFEAFVSDAFAKIKERIAS